MAATWIVLVMGLNAGPAVGGQAVDEQPPPAVTVPVDVAGQTPALPEAPRSRALVFPILYGSLTGLQAADLWTTLAAIPDRAREANPVAGALGQQTATLIALKAVTTVTTIYFVERVRKKNRKAAFILVLAINGASAAIVAHNLRHLSQSDRPPKN